ncbi:MAG: hypothetical protein ACTSRZ_05820 [Promethearchaeota archaeon]
MSYFFVKNFYRRRWIKLTKIDEAKIINNFSCSSNLELIEIRKFKLPYNIKSILNEKKPIYDEIFNPFSILKVKTDKIMDLGFSAELIFSKNRNKIENANSIIIFLHGMKRSDKIVRYFTIPLALNGHIIFAYKLRGVPSDDARRKDILGNPMDFESRVKDLQNIIDFIKLHFELKNYKINIVAESFGALTAVIGLFQQKKLNFSEKETEKSVATVAAGNDIPYIYKINKFVAISLLSNYNRVFKRFAIPFSRQFLYKINYHMKDIKIKVNSKLNKKISPYFIFKEFKQNMKANYIFPFNSFKDSNNEKNDWKNFTNKKILLIHSKNDSIITMRNFRENKKILELEPHNFLVFHNGGHSHIFNELAIISKIDFFLKN